MFEVLVSDEAADWLNSLSANDFEQIGARIDQLAERGSALGRPSVDSIKGSRHANMKELRAGTMRVLFAFDPVRQALLLVGGDKRGDWTGWYETNIPIADAIFDAHLATLRSAS